MRSDSQRKFDPINLPSISASTEKTSGRESKDDISSAATSGDGKSGGKLCS